MSTSASMPDAEKAGPSVSAHPSSETAAASITWSSRLGRWNAAIEGLAGLEATGIARVPVSARHPPSFAGDFQVAIVWVSANLTISNITVGLFGPLVFQLGFVDSALCAVFGGLLGSAATAYMSVWGPISGHRTMIVLRYFMGYWPAKIPCVLNIVMMVGYCIIDCILGGQIISAVSGDNMTMAVGIVVVSATSWVVAVFGMGLFHHYERWAWVPQILVLFVLIGCAGPLFDVNTPSSVTGAELSAARLSFFSLCLYGISSWSSAASDYFVYYSSTTPRAKTFLLTLTGLWLTSNLVCLLGIGLATGVVAGVPASWPAVYAASPGALLTQAYRGPLGGFGAFCAVVVALGVIGNCIPSVYSAALGAQVLGRGGQAVPRWAWSCVVSAATLVCALAGREHVFSILQNLLALVGYWVDIMVCIVLEEHLLVRRWWLPPHGRATGGEGGEGLDWERWQDRGYLPLGIAASVAFVLGLLGAVLGMNQVWFVGPLSTMAAGADLGMWVGCGLALVAFPPVRYWEVRVFGR